MTDQEWQAGIERALTKAWRRGWDDDADAAENLKTYNAHREAIKCVARDLAKVLPLRLALIYTRVDEIGKFRVGPARDEAA